MPIIKKREIEQMTIEQMSNKSVELKKELMKLNMQRSTGTPPENPGMIRATRKIIARINTFMTQKKKASEIENPKAVNKPKISSTKKPSTSKKTSKKITDKSTKKSTEVKKKNK